MNARGVNPRTCVRDDEQRIEAAVTPLRAAASTRAEALSLFAATNTTNTTNRQVYAGEVGVVVKSYTFGHIGPTLPYTLPATPKILDFGFKYHKFEHFKIEKFQNALVRK